MFSESDLNAGYQTGVPSDYNYGAGSDWGSGSILRDFVGMVSDVGGNLANAYIDRKFERDDPVYYAADGSGPYAVGQPANGLNITGFFKDNAVLFIGGAVVGLVLWKVL